MDVYGTFGWYMGISVPIVQMMVRATMIADVNNKENLRKFIPDIVAAYEEFIDCTRGTGVVNYPDICHRECYKQKDLDQIKVKRYGNPEQGSFNWYLHRSGNFIKLVANIILRAQDDLLNKIDDVFPQMVAAYREDIWDRCPDGFEAVYNAVSTSSDSHRKTIKKNG